MRNCSAQKRRFASARDDEGSLMVVGAIFFVVALLSVALINRVQGDFHNVNFQTDIEQARALAQSGVADALFQIDQRDGSPANFCNEPSPNPPSPSPCSLTSIPQAAGTVYTAHYYENGQPPSPYQCPNEAPCYVVQSQGTYHQVRYAVSAVVASDPVVNSALTGSTITFNGNVKLQSINVTGPDGNVLSGATANVSIASGGTLTCHGNPPGQTSPLLFIEYQNSSTNCTPVVANSSSFVPEPLSTGCPSQPNNPATPCLPGSAKSCPYMVPSSQRSTETSGDNTNGWTIGTTSNTTTIEPGQYVCYGGLTMQGTVNVDYTQTSPLTGNRVEIYVVGPQSNPSASPPLTLAGTINQCSTIPNSPAETTPWCGADQVGDPTDLQIYATGTQNADVTNLTSIDALLWAPGMSLYLHGQASPLTWTGALVINTMTTNGTPATLSLNYDERLATEFQVTAWQVSSYLQTTAGFAIP